MLSKTYQNENIDMVDVLIYRSQTQKQLERIQRKDFLNNVKEEEGKHLFQNVKLKDFNNDKTIVSSEKNVCFELVKNAKQQQNHCIKILRINSNVFIFK